MLYRHSELLETHRDIEEALDNNKWSTEKLIKLCQAECNEEVHLDYNNDNGYWKAYVVLPNNLKPLTIRGSQYALKLALADLLINLRDYNFFLQRQKDAKNFFNYVEKDNDI